MGWVVLTSGHSPWIFFYNFSFRGGQGGHGGHGPTIERILPLTVAMACGATRYSLYSLATFVFDSDDFDVPDVVANAQHTALTACVNLRAQCEALAKEKGLYSEKRGGGINWKQAQEARVKCLDALSAYKGNDLATKKQLLMDAIVLTIFTYGPVGRVGVIRKLRLIPLPTVQGLLSPSLRESTLTPWTAHTCPLVFHPLSKVSSLLL